MTPENNNKKFLCELLMYYPLLSQKAFLSHFKQCYTVLLHKSFSPLLYSSPAAILPLTPLLLIPSDSTMLSFIPLLCVPTSPFTDMVVKFLHTHLPSPLDSFSDIKVRLACLLLLILTNSFFHRII